MPDEKKYYVLDARTVVGNCCMWWCPNGQGYTCNLDRAGLYTQKEVERMRGTDVAVPEDIATRLAIRHVRIEHLREDLTVGDAVVKGRDSAYG